MTDREREIETERQADRQRDTDTVTERDRQTERERKGWRAREVIFNLSFLRVFQEGEASAGPVAPYKVATSSNKMKRQVDLLSLCLLLMHYLELSLTF